MEQSRIGIVLRPDEHNGTIRERFTESSHKIHIHPPIDQTPEENHGGFFGWLTPSIRPEIQIDAMSEQLSFTSSPLDALHQGLADRNDEIGAINEPVLEPSGCHLIDPRPDTEIINAIVDPFAH